MSDYLEGCGLPLRWAGLARFVILDSGFGQGERLLATLAAWRADPRRARRLHYIALAAEAVDAAALPAELREQWPPAVAGLQRLSLDGGMVTLDLMPGPPDAGLAQLDARVDAVYLAAPLRSATALARLARPGAALCAPALDGARRGALSAAGFVFAAQGGDAVFAGRQPEPAAPAPAERHAVVIGAGVAGAAACERLSARGWRVTLVERHAEPAQEASGNLAGIFMPLLSKDDNLATRLSRAAFLYALRHWQRLGGIGTAFMGARCGVLQLARDPAHAAQQRQIAAAAYPPEYARWLEPDQAGALLGAPAPDGGWWFEQGGWARPSTLCGALLDACGAGLERIFSSGVLALERRDGVWLVHGDGGVIAQAPTVVLANGCGATALAQAAGLPLLAVRGQVTHLAEGSLAQPPLVVCGDAYMTPPSGGTVCVGATYDSDADPGLRAASQQDNLQRLAAMLGQPVLQAPLAGRTGFRCVAPDRLPLVGALPDPRAPGRCERLRDVPRWPGLYGLLAYASRGMIWAPLAAELLAAQLDGEPLPLEANLAAALDPARFLLKELRRRP
ncbi:FAD-dependent 5-carboxymethylaminomethyl-2-thiouridine(34) oxidoreductase MnmC [Janthinobacterium fluminis]|uniref:tRNA 5-methylaminomethyl-2-thiouridine biosynthesis bifunctional protein MnmC n=1 Tax=Janthinobacterium fluminis TaxID=2987524 RepID=A0ABT5K598_9BURK|nr:FAD-dependent 5-carboxymethylaminomethyl-2-thiouridine(34) oxidoreductase MnmC [Janthinobacterium fluminis]MDC8760177.1 FAD-dependent 5-carboxymethylaminomethyl-2-thiouridine(34) oxidoreductase MnmC [Janthinobacterium fluminis]